MDCQWHITDTEKCGNLTSGKSKYCKEHKALARAVWKANREAEREAKAAWESNMLDLFKQASDAGIEAGEEALPTPMVVQQHANSLDDSSPVVKEWHVGGGVCGFAWVKITPGNCKAANYAKKHHGASKSYGGGVSIWINHFGQSYERKIATARAMAEVLQDGLEKLDPKASVYPGGRLD